MYARALAFAFMEAVCCRVAELEAKGQPMSLLKWALIMFVISLVAALFGFTGLAAASADVARILFYIFLVIFLVLLVLGLVGARAARGP
jgi:uncharacterized membrane protein YtjA (UPF0391 family)